MEVPSTSSSCPSVKLVIRDVYSPSQSLSLNVDPSMLVADLKCRLSIEFPTTPAVPSQKLIFGGKICSDDQPLAQILAQMRSSRQNDIDVQEPIVFHLLISGGSPHRNVAEAQTQRMKSNEGGESSEMHSTSTSTAPPPSVPFDQTADLTSQQQNLYRQNMLLHQQAMVLQQIQYLQYLLMQQRLQQAVPEEQQPLGAHFTPYGHFCMMQPPMFPTQTPAPVPPQAQDPTGAAAANPRPRGMILEMMREVFPLLDFRMAVKMAFMLFIVGQDTPVERILVLGLLSFISYLHITGIFAKLFEVYNRRRRASIGADPNAPVDPNAPRAAAASGAMTTNRYGILTRILRISAEGGVVQDVKHFMVGLLLSLVPAWHPQPIQEAAPMHENIMRDDVPLQGL